MTQRLPPSLAPLDLASAELLRDVIPVMPRDLALDAASGAIAAEMPAVSARPAHDLAALDGFACHANDLVGASSYAPLQLIAPPVWVDAGDAMPAGCDCVLDLSSVDASTSPIQILSEALPGQGVRRAGSDLPEGAVLAAAGQPVGAGSIMLARAAGVAVLRVRRPRLRLVNVPSGTVGAQIIADLARAAGADVTLIHARSREASAIAEALDPADCDALLTIGGTGEGRGDAMIEALAGCGDVLAHGIALQPGRTAAIGRLGTIPVVALPGTPDQAIGGWFALALPLLNRLAGRRARTSRTAPLARKIASRIGIAEIAVLADDGGAWMPLATGELTLHAISRADAWLTVDGDSEGFAAGEAVTAYLIRE